MTFFGILIHLFTPHSTNNHRSRILHVDALAGYVLLFLLFNFGVQKVHTRAPDILGYATDIHIEQLLAAMNAQRQRLGLTQLALNSKLSQAAARKAQDMFEKNYWAHTSPVGITPWDFIIESGYRYTVAGENLAKNFSNSTGVVDAWMASTTHKDNIIKPSYKEVGFAVVNGKLNGEETTLVVQMFGSSNESTATAVNPTNAPVVAKVLAVEEPVLVEVNPATVPASVVAAGVTLQPLVNIPTMTRDIVFVFAGVLIGVLLLDAWIVSRKKIVRIAGHNIAHLLFLSAIILAIGSIQRGALL